MIGYVKTAAYGLVRADVAEALEENDRRLGRIVSAAKRRALLKRAREEAAKRNMSAAERADLLAVVSRMSPGEAVARTFARMREEVGEAEMLRRYPCRACKVVTDETYRGACLQAGIQPCYVAANMKGCPAFQPRAIAVATPGA